eukprot:COSAG05_NODE_1480_length_4767_cov_2.424379_2_plen_91_part_00
MIDTAKMYDESDLRVSRVSGADPYLIYKTLAGKEVERTPCSGKSEHDLVVELAARGICPKDGCSPQVAAAATAAAVRVKPANTVGGHQEL